jgi:ABC-type Zn uptake system ZnuABC Zn-binding protein ZnuA
VFRPAAIAAVLLAALALAACGGSRTSEDDSRLQVVVSLPLFADFVHQVGGDLVEVSSLLPSGADPHTYEPTPQDVRRVTEAHLAFANGFNLEPGILNVIEPNLPNAASLIELAQEAAAAGATLRETDPHLWLSVDNVREYVRIIRDALTETDPEGAAKYEQNYQGYLTRLDELDEYVQDKLSALPPERRKLVTTHDAFGYLAGYIGFEVAAVVSVSPGQEPSAADIAELVQTIEEVGVAAVFEEPQLGAEASVLKQVADDADVEVCTLYSGALDDQVPTYIDLMRFNADELVRCLGV